MKNTKLAHILLVEDNDGDILLTKEAFEESKVVTKLSVVKTGLEALKYLRGQDKYADKEKPDLILLDINIPVYNGHYVLEEIKKDVALKKIPVIMLTTSSNPKDIDKAYLNHANSYVIKPLDMEDFLAAILKIEEFWIHLTTLSK